MPFQNEHSARVVNPDKFNKDSFRSKEIAPGIRIIVGKLKGQSSMTTQTYRFDADKFTAAEAKDWIKSHKINNIDFEEAMKKATDQMKDKVIEFLKKNPAPKDETQFHKFAEKVAREHGIAEETAYEILGDLVAGGKSKGKIYKVDPKELALGIQVEYEHTKDKAIAEKIARDHLYEIKDYYSRLKKMEKEADKPMKKAFIKISDTVYVRLDPLEKARVTKYIKRVPKPSGKGFYYFYTKKQFQDYKEKGIVPDEKKESGGNVWDKLKSFFGGDPKEKVSRLKETLFKNDAVTTEVIADHLAEYMANKEKWDARFNKDKKEPAEKKEKSEAKERTEPTEKKEKTPSRFDMSIMKKIAGQFGVVATVMKGKGEDKGSKDNSDTMPEGIAMDVNKMRSVKIPKEIKAKGIDSKEYKQWVKENWSKDTSDKSAVMSEGKGIDKETEKKVLKNKFESPGFLIRFDYQNYNQKPIAEVIASEEKILGTIQSKYAQSSTRESIDESKRDIKKLEEIKNKGYNTLSDWMKAESKANSGDNKQPDKREIMSDEGKGSIETPYLMTKDEWNKARESLKSETFGSARHSTSEEVKKIEDLKKLIYGVSDEASQKLKKLIDEKKTIPQDELDALMERVNTPISHKDVVEKALKEGKKVPVNILKDYPDLEKKYGSSKLSTSAAELEKKVGGSDKAKPSDKSKEKPSKKETGTESFQKKYDKAKQVIASFEEEHEKKSYTESEWQDYLKEIETEAKDYLKENKGDNDRWYKESAEDLKKVKEYNDLRKNLSKYKEKAMEEAGQSKMFKASQLLLEELRKAKEMPVGTISRGRKKMPNGKWLPVTDGKKKGTTDEKTDPKKKDEQKPEQKKGLTDENKSTIRSTLKKVASILADAFSGRDTITPTAQAVEEGGETMAAKDKAAKQKKEAEKKNTGPKDREKVNTKPKDKK